jgi:hypothetical protein
MTPLIRGPVWGIRRVMTRSLIVCSRACVPAVVRGWVRLSAGVPIAAAKVRGTNQDRPPKVDDEYDPYGHRIFLPLTHRWFLFTPCMNLRLPTMTPNKRIGSTSNLVKNFLDSFCLVHCTAAAYSLDRFAQVSRPRCHPEPRPNKKNLSFHETNPQDSGWESEQSVSDQPYFLGSAPECLAAGRICFELPAISRVPGGRTWGSL